MEAAPTATLTLPGASPTGSVPAWAGLSNAARRSIALAASALACIGAGVVSAAFLAGTYLAKRRLDIDVFPGLDMLPDPKIEALIRAAVGLLRW